MISPATTLVITGIRDLTDDDRRAARVCTAMLFNGDVRKSLRTIRFGGARGIDTLVLLEAHKHIDQAVLFEIFVPCMLRDQTKEAQDAIEYISKNRDNFILHEMRQAKYNPQRWQARNIAMLRGGLDPTVATDKADGVLAFWHGQPGGTFNTMVAAVQDQIQISVVPMQGDGEDAD